LEVEKDWDPQKVGKLIGVPLGGAIRRAIEPFIINLTAERDAAISILREWAKFASDISPNCFAGSEWLCNLNNRTWKAIKGGTKP